MGKVTPTKINLPGKKISFLKYFFLLFLFKSKGSNPLPLPLGVLEWEGFEFDDPIFYIRFFWGGGGIVVEIR